MEGQKQIINEDERFRKHGRDNKRFSSCSTQPHAWKPTTFSLLVIDLYQNSLYKHWNTVFFLNVELEAH